MTPSVTIVGTSHIYQFENGTCTPEDAREFQGLLDALRVKVSARLIAEEMSLDALEFRERTQSTVKALCDRIGITHDYSDPSKAQQAERGIFNSGSILANAQMWKWPDAKRDEALANACTLRETFWVDRLTERALWPAVFVCGSDHVDGLVALMATRGWQTTVATRDWVPARLAP